MTTEQHLDGNLRFVIATRTNTGKYGPQSKDMSLSDLIGIFTPVLVKETVIFPDLTALAHRFDLQIREHFSHFREEELAQAYDVLFNTWTQTGSISDSSKRSRRWEKVMDQSMEYILLAQKRMPAPKRFWTMESDFVAEVATKGKMYCEALLFHIISRSAFDTGSLVNDITLRGYCHWLKDWLRNYIGQNEYNYLLFSAAITQPDFCPVLQHLAGEENIQDAGSVLIGKIQTLKEYDFNRVSSWNQSPGTPVEYNFKLNYHAFNKECWGMVEVLRDLHYRVNRIEHFLGILEEKGENVDFTRTGETGTIMETMLAEIESNTSPAPFLNLLSN